MSRSDSSRRALRRFLVSAILGSAGVSAVHAQELLFRWDGTETYSLFGYSGAIGGDFDRDGWSDLIVGEPNSQVPGRLGQVFLLSGQTGDVIRKAPGERASDAFGQSVAALGDIDGDEVDDFAVGSSGAYVQVLSGATCRQLTRIQVSSRGAMCGVGDVNGDGLDDLAIADPGALSNRGQVFVYSPKTGALLHTLSGENDGDFFGVSICSPGDLNSDGLRDLVVGAQGWPTGQSIGRVYAFSGASPTILFHHDGPGGFTQYGAAVSGAGDVDGDSVLDIVVGAPLHAVTGYAEALSGQNGSSVRVFRGNGSGNELFGTAVAPVGDVDCDGFDDVAISSTLVNLVQIYSGKDGLELLRIDSLGNAGLWGWMVAGGRDVNRDGLPDLLVGGPGISSDAGGAALFSVAFLPEFVSVTPDRGNYKGGTPITIKGAHFDVGIARVEFGGVPLVGMTVIDAGTIVGTLPPQRPGTLPDIVLWNGLGQRMISGAFICTPFMKDPVGDLRPDGYVTNTYLIEPKDTVYAIFGLSTGSTPVPPFDGVIGIDPYFLHFVQPAWPLDSLVRDDSLPNDASISGLMVFCQSLVGPKLAGKHRSGAMTNVVSFVIQ